MSSSGSDSDTDSEFWEEVDKQADFTVTCYKRLFDDNFEENACASPLSIALMLAMVAAGARGETREQFSRSLGLPPSDYMHEFAEEMLAAVFVEHWHGNQHGFFHHDTSHDNHHHHHHHRPRSHSSSNHSSGHLQGLPERESKDVFHSNHSSGHLRGLPDHSLAGHGEQGQGQGQGHHSPGPVKLTLHKDGYYSNHSSGHLSNNSHSHSGQQRRHSSHHSGHGHHGHDNHHHHHNNHPHGPLQAFSNGLWLDRDVPVKPSFAKLLKDKYLTEVHIMDFRDKGEDTSWHPGSRLHAVGSPTSGKSQGIILTNALYFRGRWKEPFHEWNTKPEGFHLLNGHTVKVPMMTSEKKRLIGTFDQCKVLKLPYHDDADDRHLAMYIILPEARYGLLKLESKLNGTMLQQMLKCVNQTEVGQFKLPRFKISLPALDVREVLQSMGLVLPFAPGAADFSDVVDGADQKLHISTVLHQAFVEVYEGETRTSAAAHTLLGIMHIHPHHHHRHHQAQVDFVADHPFLFVIKDDTTDAILFMGRVTDPSTDHHLTHNSHMLPSSAVHGNHSHHHGHGHKAHHGHHGHGHGHGHANGQHHPRDKHHWYSSLWKHMHF